MLALLQQVSLRLQSISETPDLDASVLLSQIVGKSRTWVLAHSELQLSEEETIKLEAQLRQLELGIPLPYVIGHWEFFGLDFNLTPDVLIPRPETELLVETALTWLKLHDHSALVLDIGTGSGAIAVSLAYQLPSIKLISTDISRSALTVAAGNARAWDVSEKIDFVECDLLPPITASQPIDVICANLPYIPTSNLQQLDVFRREPTLALDGGPDGLVLVRRLLHMVQDRRLIVGLILLEIEATCGPAALQIAKEYFPAAQVRLRKDLAGQDRLLHVEMQSSLESKLSGNKKPSGVKIQTER